MEKRGPSCNIGGDVKWYSHYGEQYAAKSLQLCLTLCDPIDSSPPGFPVPGILQARTLEWVAISFSNAWKWKVKVKSLSRVRLCATPWTAAHLGFSRQEYWSGMPLWRFLKKKKQTNKLKLKENSIWPSNSTPGHISWENHNSKRHTYPKFHCSTIYNSQDMETT